MRRPFKIGNSLIAELGSRAYGSQYDSVREAISNGIDAGSRNIEVNVDGSKISIEDWGSGIENVEKFVLVGNDHKKMERLISGTTLIGEKSIGRLSYLKLGKDIVFYTRNRRPLEYKIRMDSGYVSPEGDAVEAGMNDEAVPIGSVIDHTGTKVVISDLEYMKPSFLIELEKYLSKVFSYILTTGWSTKKGEKPFPVRIRLNGNEIQPSIKYDFRINYKKIIDIKTREGLIRDVEITGNLKEDNKGEGCVDVFVQHILLTTKQPLEIDRTRLFSGWINCDAITPETSRDGISPDEKSEAVIALLYRDAQRFPSRGHTNMSVKTESSIKNMFQRMLEKAQLEALEKKKTRGPANPEGEEGIRENKDRATENEPYNDNKHPPTGRTKPPLVTNKNKNKKSGIKLLKLDLGYTALPVSWNVNHNALVVNTTHPFYSVLESDAVRLGPWWFKMAHYLARALFQMNPACREIEGDFTATMMYIDRRVSEEIEEHKLNDNLKDYQGFPPEPSPSSSVHLEKQVFSAPPKFWGQ